MPEIFNFDKVKKETRNTIEKERYKKDKNKLTTKQRIEFLEKMLGL